MSNNKPDWLSVDKDGLARIVDRVGRHRILIEPYSNAADEDGVTRIDITLQPIDGRRGVALYRIEDDSPTGFLNLADSYTLFAKSYKTGEEHVEKRGRFNSGDKRFLSICESATIRTTTGTVTFGETGRSHNPRAKTEKGSVLEAVVKLTAEQRDKAIDLIRRVIVPDGVTVTLNGETLTAPKPVLEFEATLPTQFLKDDEWRDTARKTRIRLFETADGERAQIFELGVPVVEDKDARFHVDVAQKVPLGEERNNVSPSYLRKLREAVLNNSYQLLSGDDATSRWVRDALPNATPEAAKKVLTERYGDKFVVSDPRDPEANKLAAAAGYTVVNPKSHSKEEWANFRQHNLIPSAGKVTPSHASIQLSTQGQPPIVFTDLSAGMRHVAAYAMHAANIILGRKITVSFYSVSGDNWLAAYGPGALFFNVGRLGRKWFDSPDPEEVIALLIHEFAHERCSDHLSHKYHDALCEIGAAFWANHKALDFTMVANDPELLDLLRGQPEIPLPEGIA